MYVAKEEFLSVMQDIDLSAQAERYGSTWVRACLGVA